MLVATTILMLVEPPCKGIFTQVAGKITLQCVQRILNRKEIVGIPIEITIQVGAAVFLREEQLLAQCERILNLTLGNVATRPAVIIDTGGSQKIHNAGIQYLSGTGGGAGAEIIRTAQRAIERTYQNIRIMRF